MDEHPHWGRRRIGVSIDTLRRWERDGRVTFDGADSSVT
jgi:predicted site-specific integrase-resolvase